MAALLLIEAALLAFCVGSMMFGPTAETLEREHAKFQERETRTGDLIGSINAKVDRLYIAIVRRRYKLTGSIGIALLITFAAWTLR